MRSSAQMCRRIVRDTAAASHHVTKAAQLTVSHFSFSSRYFYNKTIVPRFFGFMRRNLTRWLFSTPHYSRRPIVYVKIDGRTHNRDARRGQLSSFHVHRRSLPLTRALFSDDDERERGQNSPLFSLVEGERQIF
jgi:hypothetical protein